MSCGIYCYIDKKDNSIVYVGKDSNINENNRHKAHFASSNYNKQKINRVLQNNPNRYTYQVLAWNVTDQDTLNALETSYITHLKPKFNFTNGGDGIVGYKHTDEAKRKIGESRKNKHSSKVTRNKLSELNKGKNNPMFGKRGQLSPRYGMKHSEESKQKISQNNAKIWKNKKRSKKDCISISKAKNTTGFYRVFKSNEKKYKQGFVWYYNYYENGKQKKISSVDLFKLEQKVKSKGLHWLIIDEEKAQKTLDSLKNE